MNEHKELAIRALVRMMEDNTELSSSAFRNYTPEQMNQKYRNTGLTPIQIQSNYEEYISKIRAAIDWVKAQMD